MPAVEPFKPIRLDFAATPSNRREGRQALCLSLFRPKLKQCVLPEVRSLCLSEDASSSEFELRIFGNTQNRRRQDGILPSGWDA